MPKEAVIISCGSCGIRFQQNRVDQVYCGGTCRQRAHKAQKTVATLAALQEELASARAAVLRAGGPNSTASAATGTRPLADAGPVTPENVSYQRDGRSYGTPPGSTSTYNPYARRISRRGLKLPPATPANPGYSDRQAE